MAASSSHIAELEAVEGSCIGVGRVFGTDAEVEGSVFAEVVIERHIVLWYSVMCRCKRSLRLNASEQNWHPYGFSFVSERTDKASGYEHQDQY